MLRIILSTATVLVLLGCHAGHNGSDDLILHNFALAAQTIEKFPFDLEKPRQVYSREMARNLWRFIKGDPIQKSGKSLLDLALKYQNKLPDFLALQLPKDDLWFLFIPSLHRIRESLQQALRIVSKLPPNKQRLNLIALWRLFDSLVSNPRQPSFLLASISVGMLQDILSWARAHNVRCNLGIPRMGRLLLHLDKCRSSKPDECVYTACLFLWSKRVPMWTHQWAVSVLLETTIQDDFLQLVKAAVLREVEKRGTIYQHLLQWAKTAWSPSANSNK